MCGELTGNPVRELLCQSETSLEGRCNVTIGCIEGGSGFGMQAAARASVTAGDGAP